MITFPVAVFFTGYPPLCPYVNFSVFPPRARVITWCPRTSPNTGSFPITFLSSSAVSVRSVGFPGPFDTKRALIPEFNISSAFVLYGKTVTLNPFPIK